MNAASTACVTTSLRRRAGFTLVATLVLVAVLGIMAGTAATLVSQTVQRDREAELLFRGQAYIAAIKSYHLADTGNPVYPRRIEDLLNDPRFPGRRHLRQPYDDPMTKQGWELLRAPDGGIAGVASRSRAEPRRKSGFPVALGHFEGATTYAEWQFLYPGRPPDGAPGRHGTNRD